VKGVVVKEEKEKTKEVARKREEGQVEKKSPQESVKEVVVKEEKEKTKEVARKREEGQVEKKSPQESVKEVVVKEEKEKTKEVARKREEGQVEKKSPQESAKEVVVKEEKEKTKEVARKREEEQVEKKSPQESVKGVVVKEEKEKTKEVARKTDKILESEEKSEPTMKDPSSTKSESPEVEVALSLPKESKESLIAEAKKKEGIPGKEEKKVVKPEEISKIKENTYIVKEEDNLWLIARRFNTRVKNLKAINNLTSNRLDKGDVLLIPQTSEKELHVKKSVKEITNEGKQSSPDKRSAKNIPKRKLTSKQPLEDSSKSKTTKKPVKLIKKVSINKLSPEIANPDKALLFPFISSYFKAYKNRDIKSFEAFFQRGAKENGIKISKILPSYRKNFSSLEIVKYDFIIDRIYLKDQLAYINGDFELKFKDKNDRKIKNSRGRLNWILSWQDNNWKIKELNYSLNKKNLEAQNL
ncbi:LysM peptidoglycan-binding domain-containing protein, partial [Desulfobacterota bacterium AH_259_B03_O07]|nr:LysM peptidoglycan-binding domain-containing protein [Desulfobacterota bacterium AH_259_B03_O07]